LERLEAQMKLGELAKRLGLELRGKPETEITGPAPIDSAGAGTITFVGDPKYAAYLEKIEAACVIVKREMAASVQGDKLISENPYVDFSRAMEVFFPPYRPEAVIDESARIAADARIEEGASIGANSVIGRGVRIGKRAVIYPNVTIYPEVTIGDDFQCHSGVSIRERISIGSGVTIHNGAVVGADGFGYVMQPTGYLKIPQTGGVVIEDDVEIGANATIDRAAMGVTIIRRGSKLDNLVHIGHNCDIGEHGSLSAQTGISGSVKIGEWCVMGGQVGSAGHLTIGRRVRVAAQSGIPNDVPDDATIGGYPAIEIRKWRRLVAAAPRLPEILKRLRAVEAKVGLR
jgi:UDP-3-O-[3-hydroxymyristoyl] glucosamine N-acyltransferase